MAIVQISKIQVRTGDETDLPQLDIGEIGFTTDTKKVFIGNDPLLDPPVGIQPTLTQILTDSPNCYINANQLVGNINSGTTQDTNIVTKTSVPSTSSSTGVAGQIAYDNTHIYVCISTNTWVRASLSTW